MRELYILSDSTGEIYPILHRARRSRSISLPSCPSWPGISQVHSPYDYGRSSACLSASCPERASTCSWAESLHFLNPANYAPITSLQGCSNTWSLTVQSELSWLLKRDYPARKLHVFSFCMSLVPGNLVLEYPLASQLQGAKVNGTYREIDSPRMRHEELTMNGCTEENKLSNCGCGSDLILLTNLVVQRCRNSKTLADSVP